ncbi:MAG: hypothetical protein IKQ67_08040 [Candidatus Methanomethylophilaceae archaeon]|nr:hypothetical protein [Candidatus Methanomethylophilaceae archaeon]
MLQTIHSNDLPGRDMGYELSDEEVYHIGMELLFDRLGFIDAQRFLVYVKRNAGDYTLERREIFDNLTTEEIMEDASNYMREHPLSPETQARLGADRKERSME